MLRCVSLQVLVGCLDTGAVIACPLNILHCSQEAQTCWHTTTSWWSVLRPECWSPNCSLESSQKRAVGTAKLYLHMNHQHWRCSSTEAGNDEDSTFIRGQLEINTSRLLHRILDSLKDLMLNILQDFWAIKMIFKAAVLTNQLSSLPSLIWSPLTPSVKFFCISKVTPWSPASSWNLLTRPFLSWPP